MKYELLPGKDKDLRCHIVVTSYETPSDDSCKRFFRSINWAGLIVDEGQRLKSDKNLIYEALKSLEIPFKVLLTGTPLQNNTRELFNLLQFIDNSINASELELEYTQLTKENVPRLHDLIRPFFLRRTKAQVLTFLPPMAEIIVPVTMSIVQKKLYQSILAKNPELIKSIFGREKQALSKLDKSNLNNILMQLRKCLCHPFIYSLAIEERTMNAVVSHRNLVAASSKLQLLEIMLPKLEERGHRVLIFSQFLDMLTVVEDFLDGLGLSFSRLDGTIGSLEKQKRIDAFNAPDSTIFAFLLSTRAGGVGINLATADTVIILDPDFNPHQDIQALSRAHRIGQKKKVLVFHLMTRSTAEEKIMQIGKKKMSLDHAIINSMAEDEAEEVDVESILKFGASAIFEDSTEGDIRYDSASVDLLLDRSQAEDTKTGEDKSAETQFSFARVWANEHGRLEDGLQDSEPDQQDPTVWDRILKQREKDAAEDAAAKLEDLGRGKRKRQVSYYPQDGMLVL
jgi:chromodomain-helicase-DNA-binding protein 4